MATARFQNDDRVCRVCIDCDGGDSLEHYACCPYQWLAFSRKLNRPEFPQSIARFFGLLSLDEKDSIFHSVHMFSVLSVLNQRRASDSICIPEDVTAMIWQGHRTASLHHSSLRKRYREIWFP